MKLELTAEWESFSEGDDDELIRIAGLLGYAYEIGGKWAWEVRAGNVDGSSWAGKAQGSGLTDDKNDAKVEAEAFIRKVAK